MSKAVEQAILEQAPLAEQISLALAMQGNLLTSQPAKAGLLALGSLLQRALEKTYSLSYASALAEGLYLSFCLKHAMALRERWQRLQKILIPDLPPRPWLVGGFSPKKILAYLQRDKQAWMHHEITLILPEGDFFTAQRFTYAQLETIFNDLRPEELSGPATAWA